MSQPKSSLQEFGTDWGKIRGWAADNKIPTVAVNNVYQLDVGRLQSGYYPMSNAERTRAVLAAAGLSAPTQLPSDSPSPADVWGNTVQNVSAIATGLMPTRLVANIWDTLKTSLQDIEHPDQSGGLGKMLTNTALAWLPGAYDLGQYLEAGGGRAGLDKLAVQPVTSLIDVMPFLKGLDLAAGGVASGEPAAVGAAAASSVLGKTLAGHLGLATGDEVGALRMAGRAVGRIRIGSARTLETLDADGNAVAATPSIAERLEFFKRHFGMGSQLSQAAHALSSITSKASNDARRLEKNLIAVTSDYTEPELAAFTDLMHSGKSADDILNDPNVPDNLKAGVAAFQPWEEWHQTWALDAGEILPMRLPDGSTALYEKTSPVWSSQRRADAAIERADRLSAKADEIAGHAQAADDFFAPRMARLKEIKNVLATKATISAPVTAAFGRLVGRDGLIDQMEAAAKTGNWAAFRDAAVKAERMLNNKSMETFTSSMFQELRSLLGDERTGAAKYGRDRVKLARQFASAWGTKAKGASERALKLQDEFMKDVRRNPPAPYRDVVVTQFFKNFLASDRAEQLLDSSAKYLKAHGYDQDVVDRIRSDPRRMWELISAIGDPTFRDPFLPDMTPGEAAHFMNDALREADLLRARGYVPMYVPTLSPEQALSPYLQGTDVYINPTKFRPTVNASFKRTLDASRTVNDVMLGVSRATKDALGRDALVEFFDEVVRPMVRSRTDLRNAVAKEHLGREVLTGTGAPVAGHLDALIQSQYGYIPVDVRSLLGVDQEEMQGLTRDEVYYLPQDFHKGLDKLVNKYQLPLNGIWDKTTGVFKFSILGLSPRYTAHVTFGGGMMLALRTDPVLMLKYIPKAVRSVWAYHHGNEQDVIPEEVLQGSAQLGSPDRAFHFMGGRQMGGMTVAETLARRGIPLAAAKGIDVVRAAADVNFKFTRYMSDIQRSIAYLDGSWRADFRGKFKDPITGEVRDMTPERMRWEGMQAAERVMGNLQAMTPLERAVARNIMPFYGWTKHILKYVMTYPFDHPWRAMFVTTLATQNSDSFSQGLDERMQLLFFLGSPDANGDVTAVDVRALDPFRDVANYATLSGWLSAMNPIIVAPFATVDPSIIFGDNVPYPGLQYSSVYGTTEAQPAGSWLNALEQEIPQVTTLDDALGLSAQARAIKAEGGAAWGQAMFQALGVPWVPQKLNLQQIAAKHELDRYHQAANDALTAWQTGDFSTLDTYPGTVPDPLNTDYDITPKELEAQYEAAQKRFPALPPSETVPELPSPAV